MKVKTINSEQIWQSPDAARKIWEVGLIGENGQEYQLKTYSPKIGQMGFTGEVESYISPRGERFVRQKAKAKESSGSAYKRDDNAIKAQWAIGQAINLLSVKMDKEQITMPAIENYAKQLYESVGRVKGEPMSEQELAEGHRHIKSLSQAAPSF